MLRWLRRRRLDDVAKRRLLVALARAEEELIETHVRNVLDVAAVVSDDLRLNRVLELYLDEFEPGEPRASIVARRVVAQAERGPRRRHR